MIVYYCGLLNTIRYRITTYINFEGNASQLNLFKSPIYLFIILLFISVLCCIIFSPLFFFVILFDFSFAIQIGTPSFSFAQQESFEYKTIAISNLIELHLNLYFYSYLQNKKHRNK